jgi:hypothetical protein
MIIKAILVWLLIATLETAQGIIRIKFISRKIGEPLARRLGVVTGVIIIFSICWLTMPWLQPSSFNECILIGLIWLVLMVMFDVGLGRFYFHFSWQRISYDFNLRKGGFLGIGMAMLFLMPLLVAKIQNII